MRLHQGFRTAPLLVFAILCSLPGVVSADDSINENPSWNTLTTDERQQILRELDVEQSNVFSVQRVPIETGAWYVGRAALTDRWYQDQQQGRNKGMQLVWQRSANLLSVSEEGLSLTRRF